MAETTAKQPAEKPTELPAESVHKLARPAPGFQFTVADALMVVCMCIWATHYSVAKAALDILPPFVFNAMRFSVGVVAMTVLVTVTRQNILLPRREIPRLVVIAITFYGLYQVAFIGGLSLTTVAHSVLISTVAPAGLVLLNIWRGQERGSRRIYSGILLALAGVLTVVLSRFADEMGSGSNSILIGDLLSIGGIFIWVGGTLMQRNLIQRTSVFAASFWLLVCGTGVGFVMSLPELGDFDWLLVTPPVLVAILYSGTVALVIGGTIWNFGLQRLGASRAAIYINLQPVVAAAVAIVFLHEPLTIWLIVGTALALLGMWRLRLG